MQGWVILVVLRLDGRVGSTPGRSKSMAVVCLKLIKISSTMLAWPYLLRLGECAGADRSVESRRIAGCQSAGCPKNPRSSGRIV